ncbi:MAG: DUF5615 family PIN-like protein [Bacteroidia bacterium]|nr:DUF5615 family PIN-like protein [Bacteroidia bacterium]
MKVLLDENIPRKLKHPLGNFEVFTVQDMQWDSYQNGELLKIAVENGFDAFITTDRNLQYQQNTDRIALAFIVLNVVRLTYEFIEPLIPEIIAMLPQANKGQVYMLSSSKR